MHYILWPLSVLFGLIVFLRNLFYDWGFLTQKKLSVPVLCIGNITTGGTGKTPWVQLISRFYAENSKKLAIVSRGYTGDFSGVLKVENNMDPRKCGDEPLWLRRNTDAIVYVSKSRFDAGQTAIDKENVDLIVLDDGYQHRKLHRNLDVVLLDASAPSFHYHMLPMGRLREPFRQLKRAKVVIVNKCNYAEPEQVQMLVSRAEKNIHRDKIFLADFVFDYWMPAIESLEQKLTQQDVALSCGVGNPDAFVKTVQTQGLNVIRKFIYPDHYYWKPADIEKMTYHMKQESLSDLVITEKDAVKLVRYKKHFHEMGIQIWVCKMKVQIKKREEALFAELRQLFES